MDPAGIGVIGAVINVGFAGIVGWYLLTKALPKMQEEHTKAHDTARADFLASLKEHRDSFNAEIKSTRDHADAREQRYIENSKNQLAQVMLHCERESTRRDETMRTEMATINLTLRNLMETIEEWRGDRREVMDMKRERNSPREGGSA